MMKILDFIRIAIITSTLLVLLWPKDLMAQRNWELVWSDEFEGESLDLDKWSYQLGTGSSYGLINWGNNELQFYTDREENLFLQDGYLHIRARQESFSGRNYTSARIRSIEKGDWTYGRFEIRAKLPEGRGLWPAIWMMPTESVYGGWPQSGEIDIMESLGHEPNRAYGSVHFGPQWPNNRFRTGSITLQDGSFSEDFHVFSIEWEPAVIRFYVDDRLYFIVSPTHLQPYRWPFDQDFHFILNVAVGGNWPGSPDASTTFPQDMIIDYVRVYQEAESTSIDRNPGDETPQAYMLYQNYPNPFNPSTEILLELPQSENVQLNVYNILGQHVATLIDGFLGAGTHSATFNATGLASGVYMYRLTAGGNVQTRLMTLSR